METDDWHGGYDPAEDDFDDPDATCHYCGGEGFVWGDQLSDPLWYDEDDLYTCPCCHGSGLAKDCAFW